MKTNYSELYNQEFANFNSVISLLTFLRKVHQFLISFFSN